jgi:hypothetical protein
MTHALVVALALLGAARAAEPETDGAVAAAPSEGTSSEGTSSEAPADPEAASAEAQAAAPKPADLLAEMARMRAELETMKKELEATRATVAGQDQRLEGTVKDLTNLRTKMVSAKDFKIDLTGYYRVRGYVYGAKFGEDKPTTGGLYSNQPTSGRFMNQRLRVGVKFGWKDVASLNVHFQALDDVVWGDNADIGSNPLFAEKGSYTGISGEENPNFEVFRAWAEMKVPLGLIRVGRQSSHWGLGLLANHGDGFDDDFGENHFGNQFDRFLFATNPIAIAQAFTKKQERNTPQLNVVVAVDRLVEDPLTQYYGYKCTAGIDREVDPARYDVRCDSDGDGYTDREHDYTDDGRTADQRRPDWWVDQKDDVWEMVYALLYRGKDIRYFGGTGDLTAGAYVIHRRQKETDSDVVVADLYLDAFVHHVGLQFEGVGIWGKTRALPLRDSTPGRPAGQEGQDHGLRRPPVLRAALLEGAVRVRLRQRRQPGQRRAVHRPLAAPRLQRRPDPLRGRHRAGHVAAVGRQRPRAAEQRRCVRQPLHQPARLRLPDGQYPGDRRLLDGLARSAGWGRHSVHPGRGRRRRLHDGGRRGRRARLGDRLCDQAPVPQAHPGVGRDRLRARDRPAAA